MKILLIEPEAPYKAPNLGLLHLAQAITSSSHEVLFRDFNALASEDAVKEAIAIAKKYAVGVVGISVYDVSYQWAQDFIKRFTALCDTPLVAGGPQVNGMKQDFMEDNPTLEWCMSGECEESVMAFLDFLENRGTPNAVPGLIYRENEEIKTTAPALVDDMDSIPVLDYSRFGISSLSGMMIWTTRGCPYKCTFCARNTGDVWRKRSISSCIDEIVQAKEKYGINSFRIIDASFNIDQARVSRFCKALIDNSINLPWMVSGIRADRLTEKNVMEFVESGCQMLNVGIESLNPDVFYKINKGETLEEVKLAVRMGKKHGLEIGCYMIHGLPGDTCEKAILHARELQDLEPDYAMFNHAIPLPGTELLKWVDENGYSKGKSTWQDTREMTGSPYWTDDFSEEERVRSFNTIQTITKVINFSSTDEEDLATLVDEIRKNDPEYYDHHMDYINRRLKLNPSRIFIKRFHSEKEIKYIDGYTGLMNVSSSMPLVVPNI